MEPTVAAAPAPIRIVSPGFDPPPGKSSVKPTVEARKAAGTTEPIGKPAEDPLGPNHTHLLGEPTMAAGMYFLLNALRYLGIDAALEPTPLARGTSH